MDIIIGGTMEEDKWECPACGKEIAEDYCECGFDFNEVLSCPKKDKDNICTVTNQKCLKGMSYEACEVLRTIEFEKE